MTMNHLQFPLTQSATAIILNGQRDCLQKLQQHWQDYQRIIVCDGAWYDVATFLNLSEATEKVVVLGDGDSIQMQQSSITNQLTNHHRQNIAQLPKHFIHITEQDSTDFEKALRWLLKQMEEENKEEQIGQTNKPNIDVYWANGGELDHTLGNMALSAKYYQAFSLHFYTDSQYYCYLKDSLRISGVKGKTLSIFPFPKLWIKATQGLTYPMTDYLMQMHTQQSLRNDAEADEVLIEGIGSGFVFVAYPLAT